MNHDKEFLRNFGHFYRDEDQANIDYAMQRKKETEKNLDAIRGCTFGGAVGDALGCAGVTPEKHEAALETMRFCVSFVKRILLCGTVREVYGNLLDLIEEPEGEILVQELEQADPCQSCPQSVK